jgi:UPF0271 protein
MTTPARTIDLNCDMGESDEPARVAADLALLEIVTSANIACGGHAGDRASMERTIRAATERGVAIGAHPSYPDRANFGRGEQDLSARAIEATVAEQIGELASVARSLGATLSHVKPHGALYHAAMTRMDVAEAIARGTERVDRGLALVGLAGAGALERWRKLGFIPAAEAFADRRYEPDGSLRSRAKPGAMIQDAAEAAAQAVGIALGRGVVASNGARVEVRAATICLHSDTTGAVEIAREVRRGLEGAGIQARCV